LNCQQPNSDNLSILVRKNSKNKNVFGKQERFLDHDKKTTPDVLKKMYSYFLKAQRKRENVCVCVFVCVRVSEWVSAIFGREIQSNPLHKDHPRDRKTVNTDDRWSFFRDKHRLSNSFWESFFFVDTNFLVFLIYFLLISKTHTQWHLEYHKQN
jgi:hypothetical protein